MNFCQHLYKQIENVYYALVVIILSIFNVKMRQ